MSKNKSLLMEIWDFVKMRKIWWLTPIIIMLILMGIIILAQSSALLSPFIYAIF